MIPVRLRHQSWLAAMLLLSIWLVAAFGNFSLLRHRPVAFLGLLPGLAVTGHILQQLFRHLRANHGPGDEGRLFPTLGAANWITLLRAGAVVALAGFLPITLLPGHGVPEALLWVPGLVYLGIALADLVDGAVARRQQRETELGKRLDITCDAAGLLVASLLAVGLGRLPAIYLLAGLAYYPFILGIWWRHRRGLPLLTLPPRPYGRIIAGFQMGLAGVALLPFLDQQFIFVAAYIFMTPLLAGFVRDWLVVSCRAAADTILEQKAGDVLTRGFPVVLRLIVLVAGVAILAESGGYQAHPVRQLVLGFCCLLVVCAFLGRSAAFVLVMLLGGNLPPFGTSLPVMILFCAAAALMLSGTGGWSLWTPEDALLSRRNIKTVTACEAAT
jgi:CDP-diacylglycerol--glycerol-3-phosphate 3-phosphatidyltransferase